MFISRFVGLLPKLVTRVRAPLTVASAALKLIRKEVENCILMEATLDSALAGASRRHVVRHTYAFDKEVTKGRKC